MQSIKNTRLIWTKILVFTLLITFIGGKTAVLALECQSSPSPDQTGQGVDTVIIDPDCPGVSRDILPEIPYWTSDRSIIPPILSELPPVPEPPIIIGGLCNLMLPDPDIWHSDYLWAQGITDVPWEVLNAIHYIETTYADIGNSGPGTNVTPFQILGKNQMRPSECDNLCEIDTVNCSSRNNNTDRCYPYIPYPANGIGFAAVGAAMFLIDFKLFDRSQPYDNQNIIQSLILYNGAPGETPVPEPYGCSNNPACTKLTRVWGDYSSPTIQRQYPYAFYGIAPCYCDIYYDTGPTAYYNFTHYGTYSVYRMLRGLPNNPAQCIEL